MRLCIYGSDRRGEWLRKLAVEKGYILTDIRPDAVVLPLPKAKYSDLKRMFPKGQMFICGMVDDDILQAAKENRWQLANVLQDETFQMENAVLTAEAAVWKAMKSEKGALCRKKCLVIGYGRIGKTLTGLLRGLGSEVIVAARRTEARKEAGENSVSVEEMGNVIGNVDWVFNTVPHVVMDEKVLKRMNGQTPIMELASVPYGVDMEKAAQMGIQVQIEGGLPGRYCPEDAARAWLDFIERSVGK